MHSNRDIQRAAALARSNRARADADARRRKGCAEAGVRVSRDVEHAAWSEYRRLS